MIIIAKILLWMLIMGGSWAVLMVIIWLGVKALRALW